ncbi:D-alanyl-D-alanine carboxypeptidase [Streptomyces sp. YC419]|uniref:D-alanyl-D-alanine carboxypeptidase n=1 Tax=Streptomyces ureilyticus TaxID=1775131 RepID=A0ABX0DR78_9ACTN|nr:D-alanyl-D-alanine carboxypeptidase [Streptomyces ureilyticus]
MNPTTVPRTKEMTASVRCTQKYPVGSPSSKASPLPSATRFLTKVIQMTQLHTPKASRNQETGRLSFIRSVSLPSTGDRVRGEETHSGVGRGGANRRGEGSGGEGGATSRPGPGTFSSVSAMKKTTKSSLLVTSATLLTLSLSATAIATGPAVADGTPTPSQKATPKASTSPSATAPADMSTVGGAQLGKAGTQVNLGTGAPVLPKDLSARSWVVADAESGDVLAAHNAHWRLAPASTLKMLFADTLLPKFSQREEKHKVVPSDLAGTGPNSSLVGIKEDETYTVHDLWLGVFLRSGNDAVRVLSAMNGGVDQTVQDMNAHAEELQALDTHVVSPDGYDEVGQVSSAYDLTLIARSGLQKKDFREYASTVRAKFPGETKKNKKGKTTRKSFEIQNTNRLLTGAPGLGVYKGIAGVKNGNTTNAGSTFTGVAERDGKVLLVTVMNPEKDENFEVYKETARLLDWGFQAADKIEPVGELVPPKSADTGTAPDAEASGEAGGSGDGNPVAASAQDAGSSGVGIALGITGGVLVLLAGGAFLVNRRWPLPDLVRRRPRP